MAALGIGLSSTGLAQNASSSIGRQRQVQFSVKLSFRTATPNIGLHITRDTGNVDRIKGGVSFEEQTNAAGNFSVPLAAGTYRLRINADQLQGVINGMARRDRSIQPNSTVVVLRFSPQIKVMAPGHEPVASSTFLIANSPQEFLLTVPAGVGSVSGQLGLYDVRSGNGAVVPQSERGASPGGNRGDIVAQRKYGENAFSIDHADRLFGNYAGIMTPDVNGPTGPTTQRIKFDLPRGSFGGDAVQVPGRLHPNEL
ncbi:MAG: hypothetical protein WBL74_11545 [Novosphingobium sp.]|uniref:hypothetical protein n=1 Tax=Novosphingobium sp. TaxID=1874826 RepID=UPI003C7E9B44